MTRRCWNPKIALPYAYAEAGRLSAARWTASLTRRWTSSRANASGSTSRSPPSAAARSSRACWRATRTPDERVSRRSACCPRCRTPATWRSCWPATSSRNRSRTCATCSSWNATWKTGRTGWPPSTTCWPTAARPSPSACPRCARASETDPPALEKRDALAAELAKVEADSGRQRLRRRAPAPPARTHGQRLPGPVASKRPRARRTRAASGRTFRHLGAGARVPRPAVEAKKAPGRRPGARRGEAARRRARQGAAGGAAALRTLSAAHRRALRVASAAACGWCPRCAQRGERHGTWRPPPRSRRRNAWTSTPPRPAWRWPNCRTAPSWPGAGLPMRSASPLLLLLVASLGGCGMFRQAAAGQRPTHRQPGRPLDRGRGRRRPARHRAPGHRQPTKFRTVAPRAPAAARRGDAPPATWNGQRRPRRRRRQGDKPDYKVAIESATRDYPKNFLNDKNNDKGVLTARAHTSRTASSEVALKTLDRLVQEHPDTQYLAEAQFPPRRAAVVPPASTPPPKPPTARC